MLNKNINIAILLLLPLVATNPLYAQSESSSDSTIDRSVTVEREFQPIIQDAGKLSVAPQRLEMDMESAEVRYSTFANPLQTDFNFNTLGCSPSSFKNKAIASPNYLEGAIGHPQTRFNFFYRLTPQKKITLDFFAHHQAIWGRRMWENTQIGMAYNMRLNAMDMYFSVDGNNRFYTRNGRYFDGDKGLTIKKYAELADNDKQNIWTIHTRIGVRTRPGDNLQYRVETGYNAYIVPNVAAEHCIRTYGDVSYTEEKNTGGIHFFMQNALYSVDPMQHLADTLYNARHGLRIEPYYEFNSEAFRIHAGVNFDLNIGKGQMMSASENVSFAPSPNVDFEYRILPEWLALYGSAKGQFNFGLLEGYLGMNPYLEIIPGITSHHVSGYVPVDAALGFRIHPVSTFLIDIYAHYCMSKNMSTFLSPDMSTLQAKQAAGDPSYLDYFYSDWQEWRVGAEFTYHYQDIVHILLGFNYHKWIQDSVEVFSDKYPGLTTTEGRAYDRPSWDLHLRVDARIDSKWSLYSDNRFAGARWALTTGEDVKLKPYINLSLGAQYEINTWLSCYLELNNLMHRHNDIFYGYQTIGINGMAGVKWRF